MAENLNSNPPEKISPGKAVPAKPSIEPDSTSFQKHMNKEPSPPMGDIAASPFDLSRKKAPSGVPSLADLSNQVDQTHSHYQTLQTQLQNNPNLKIKNSYSDLIDNKLRDANTHLQKASEQLGLSPFPMNAYTSKNPIQRFLGYVTDGQKQLLAAKQKLEQMKTEGQLNPSDLLLIQIKLSQAQQEIEYSSILLAKVMDMIKQMMNIQI